MITTTKTRIELLIRRQLRNGLDLLRFRFTPKRLPQHTASCVMYHNVYRGSFPSLQLRQHSVEALRHQLKWIKDHFTLLPLEEWFEERHRTRSPIVAVTFDDGLTNNLLALPVLEELAVPATFFVCVPSLRGQSVLWPDALDVACHLAGDELSIGNTRFRRIDGIHMTREGIRPAHFIKSLTEQERWKIIFDLSGGKKPWEDEPWHGHFAAMDAAAVNTMSQSAYVTIGAHGIAHQNFEFISDAEVLEELQSSKRTLESWTGKPVLSFAFADGSYRENTPELARSCGYRYLCAVIPRFNHTNESIAITGRYGFYSDRHWTKQLNDWCTYLRTSS